MSFYELIEIPEKTQEQSQANNLYKDGFCVLQEESYNAIMKWLIENMGDDDTYQEQFADQSRGFTFTGAVVKSWFK